MKERWTVGLFNEMCACLVWWRDTTIVAEDKWPRDCAEYLLNKLIRYGQVYRDDDEVRVSLWPNDFSEVQRIHGMLIAGIPQSDNLDLSIDYAAQAEADTEKWRAEQQAKRDAFLEQQRKEREARAADKQALLDNDIALIQEYVCQHDMNYTSVAAMSRDLGIGYNRCMRLYKKIVGER